MGSFEQLAQPVDSGKWGAILLFIGADLDYICNEVGFPHFNGVQMCAHCGATASGACPYNDFGPDAAWRATVKSNDELMACMRRPLHPLAAHPFFNRLTFRYDMLHMFDHHGVTSQVVANVLWHHVSPDRETSVLPGGNIDETIEFLNSEIAAWYKGRSVSRLPPLKQSNLKEANAFPELKGRGVKAANTRCIAPFVLALQERATAAVPTMKQRHMLKVVKALNDIYNIIYSAPTFLLAADHEKLRKACGMLAVQYQALQVDSFAAKEMLWKSTSKHHYVCAHLPWQATLINPRTVQGYMSESLVGAVCDIYKMSQSGPYHARVQEVVLLKYRTGLFYLQQ